jgi:hypothetical protein
MNTGTLSLYLARHYICEQPWEAILLMAKKMLIIGLVVLVLGGTLTSAVMAASPPEQVQGLEYAIQADDWLSKLATKYLGDSRHWTHIVQATNARAAVDPRLTIIYNPNLIYPGQIIFIPYTTPTQASPPPVPATHVPAVTIQPVQPPAAPGLAQLCHDSHPVVRAFCQEIPIARIHCDQVDEEQCFSCASRSGLAYAQFDPNGPTILVPNDGDFDLRGVVVAVKVTPEKSVVIPRWPGSRFEFPADYTQKYDLPAGEELEIPLAKAFELIKEGELTWTGVHGEPGKAGLYQIDPPLTCDPQADFEIVIGPF